MTKVWKRQVKIMLKKAKASRKDYQNYKSQHLLSKQFLFQVHAYECMRLPTAALFRTTKVRNESPLVGGSYIHCDIAIKENIAQS